MEELFDSLSKRLAKAVSRRDMLRIASGAIFSVVVASTGISRVWAKGNHAPACRDSSGCGAVQNTIQLTVGNDDPAKYEDHHEYVKAAEHAVHVAVDGDLIDRECAECIVRQFRERIPVASQYPCGPTTAPTETCASTNPSRKQIKVASELALSAAPNAWGDATQWVQLNQLAEAMLGCTLAGTDPSAASTAQVAATLSRVGEFAAVAAATTCAQPGVNYCGPGNSGDPAYGKTQVPVAPCLNEACCQHDNCYSKVCEPTKCYFSAGTATCDDPIVATCQGSASCTPPELLDAASQFVCGVVLCATVDTSQYCQNIRAARALAQPSCDQPCVGSSCCASGTTCMTAATVVQGALSGVCCPPGNTACELTCCPPGATCVNGVCGCPAGQTLTGGQCVCPPGKTLCGTMCCASGAICLNGVCATNNCPPATTACGKVCCPSGQTCTNGQCTPISTCPSGTFACPSTGGGCCEVGQDCCQNRYGEWGCGPVGWQCCSNGGSCQPNTVCCPAGDNLACCPPGTSCTIVQGTPICT